jgi:adenine phosphoribosyltransferase
METNSAPVEATAQAAPVPNESHLLFGGDQRDIRSCIRDIPDFPKPGIVFKDITPLLINPAAFAHVIDLLVARYRDRGITKVVGIEARGFLFATPLAYRLGAGLVIVRKPGKLPYKTRSTSYALEYGQDSVEMHIDAIDPGERVVLVDDVLATGGTLGAVAEMIVQSEGQLEEAAVLIELGFLGGRSRLKHDVFSLINY